MWTGRGRAKREVMPLIMRAIYSHTYRVEAVVVERFAQRGSSHSSEFRVRSERDLRIGFGVTRDWLQEEGTRRGRESGKINNRWAQPYDVQKERFSASFE